MIPLGNDVFYVIRAPLVVDPRDNTEYRDWANATRTPVIWSLVTPFELAEKLGFENTVDREHARINLKVFAPPGTDVEPTDLVEYWGEVYYVLGFPGRWRDFSGMEDHVEFIIQLKVG